MYEFIKPQIVSMKKLASHGWFVSFLKIVMPLKFKIIRVNENRPR